MKRTKSITTVVALLAGLSCVTARAGLTPVTDYAATITAIAGVDTGDTFTLNSNFTPTTGGYIYQYWFSGSPAALNSISVYFTTSVGLPSSINSAGLTPSTDTFTTGIAADDVNWNFSPGATGAADLSFFSAAAPELGTAGAIDGGTWFGSGVVVPTTPYNSVPDGGMTISLMGGALLGLGGLRRKLGC